MSEFPFQEADVARYLAQSEQACAALDIERGAPLVVSLLARGEYNVNYAFHHPATGVPLLFRVNLGSQMHLAHQIEYEAHCLQLLAPSGRTPHLYFVDGSKQFFGHGVLVEEYLAGRPLVYETDLDEAAHIMADIHSVAVPQHHKLLVPSNPMFAILDECEKMFATYRAWSAASSFVVSWVVPRLAQVRAWLAQVSPARELCMVSTEVNSGYFLINSEEPSYLVDWEKPVISEAAQDLGHFLAPTTTFWKTDTLLTAAQVQAFVEEYSGAVAGRFSTAQISDRVRAYLPLTCLRGITWCAMALAQHEEKVRGVSDAYTLAKVRAYLTPAFLEFVDQEYFG